MENNIVLARVDNRLVHGQIVVYWSKEVQPQRIAIIDKDIAMDDSMKLIYKMAAPPNYKMSILPPEKFVANMENGKYEKERILVLFKNIEGAYKAYQAGLKLESLQLGNCPKTDNTFSACPYIFMTDSQYELLHQMNEQGVQVYMQNVPNDHKLSFETIKKQN